MEKIEVVYGPTSLGNGVPVYHKYILYTNEAGNRFYSRGGPGYFGPGVALGGRNDPSISQFGNIKTQSGEYKDGTPDFDKDGKPDPRETVKTGNDLSADWDNITRAMREIDAEKYPYSPGGQNSNTAVDAALRRAGLPEPIKDGAGNNLSPASGKELNNGQYRFPDGDPFTGLPWPGIDIQVEYQFSRGLNWFQPRDPLILILDLDNDGRELTASNSTVLFDHNADGIKTGTQWARSDDGILVRDLNGNGTIDSGRELFGDQTQISTVNAAGQTITTLAAHGFAALKALDKDAAGLSDGIFNASDVAYAELKVWRDLNQDGISQSNELLGLAESGVSAINLVQTATQVTQGKSTFTKTVSGVDANGDPVSTSTEQTVQNVNFTTNNFHRAFSDNPVVTEAAAALPQMQGAGLVRDLREAMSLGTGQAVALQTSLGTSKSNSTTQADCQKRRGLRPANRCRFSVRKSAVVPKMGCIYSKKWVLRKPQAIEASGSHFY